jgi:hypothetical protein
VPRDESDSSNSRKLSRKDRNTGNNWIGSNPEKEQAVHRVKFALAVHEGTVPMAVPFSLRRVNTSGAEMYIVLICFYV